MSRVIVLGLDRANWPLAESWIEVGNLPNLAALHEEAVWKSLSGQLLPVTSLNGRCYATGCNPAKPGAFWGSVNRERHIICHSTSHLNAQGYLE